MFCNKLLHTPAPHEVLLNTTNFHLSLYPFCTQGRKPTEGGNWQSSSQTVKHEIWIIINRRTIEAHSFVQPTTRISTFLPPFLCDVPSLQPRGGDIYHSNHRPLNRSPEKLWASNKARWKATFHFASLPSELHGQLRGGGVVVLVKWKTRFGSCCCCWRMTNLFYVKERKGKETTTTVSGLVIFVGMSRSRSLDTIKFINSFGLSSRGIQYYTTSRTNRVQTKVCLF